LRKEFPPKNPPKPVYLLLAERENKKNKALDEKFYNYFKEYFNRIKKDVAIV